MRKVRRWWWMPPALVLLVLLAVAAPALYAYASTQSYRYADPAQVPVRRVALVLGAGVVNGVPTPALAERVRGAAELYRLGRVDKLLFSGDNSRQDYNEVAAMQSYAISLGVPADDITVDYAGFSTYESCYRARDIFGLRQAVIVTQHYHLPRAVYTARRLGIDAVGYGLPDWTRDPAQMTIRYSRREMMLYSARELAATVKALWQVHVTRPLPTFLGEFEGIG